MALLTAPHISIRHLDSVTHEGKVVVLATDADGKIWYTIKQDGFEDSYLNTPADQRTGWETWQSVEFPDEADDQSVVEKEKAELTYQQDTSKYLLKSRYKTTTESAVAPVQAVSALGHVYIFRQSTSNTLLVDRFVLDGMTNKLVRKLEVRFKRSNQRYTPTKSMSKGSNGLENIDSVDFRNANGNFFYEPTIELCLVNNLINGWFSVVVVPTIENDVYRWHIFAYNNGTKKVELTTLRASNEGLFEVKDYNFFEESDGILVPRKISGVIKRTLEINGVTVTNGLTATQYDLQQEQETQSGDKQLIRTATRLLLAVPTDKGAAAVSFAIAGDGTLAQIDTTPDNTLLRSKQKEILLPLNTLDEVKALGDRTPPPQGIITGLAEGTEEEDAEDLVKIATLGNASGLANGDLVKIAGNQDYQGLYGTVKVDNDTFDIDLPTKLENLGYWEKQDPEEGGLVFDGMITAYEKTAEGKLRVTSKNHGLENGDEVQITGTGDYNDTFPVQKIDDTHFVIERKWATGEAVNIKLASRKRRGIVFDGVNDYITVLDDPNLRIEFYTVEIWIKPEAFTNDYWAGIVGKPGRNFHIWLTQKGYIHHRFQTESEGNAGAPDTPIGSIPWDKWSHVAITNDGKTAQTYINGELVTEGSVTASLSVSEDSLYIGCDLDGKPSGRRYKGQMADLRVWKAARTAEEIKNNMYLQLTGKELSLVGYWRLGGISEGKVIDFSYNGQDGQVYGDPYVSAATLDRKLGDKTTDAVKYSNPELFAVSERSTYEESFEFKVEFITPTSVDLAYLNNADGKNLGNKIFTFAYWGKASRSAEEKTPIKTVVQNEFKDLGKGWFRASCNVTIPDGVSLLRSFEIANLKGNWKSLAIRKHRFRLLSDSITEAKYSDGLTLTTLANEQLTSVNKLYKLLLKEPQEARLLKEKQDLETKLAAYYNQDATRKQIADLESEIARLTLDKTNLNNSCEAAKNNPFNYFCQIKAGPNVKNCNGSGFYLNTRNSFLGHYELLGWTKTIQDTWQFISQGNNTYAIQLMPQPTNGDTVYICGFNTDSTRLYGSPSKETWKFIPSGNYYKIQHASSERNLLCGSNFYINPLNESSDWIVGWTGSETTWELVRTETKTDAGQKAITEAETNLNQKTQEIESKKTELASKKDGLTATPLDKDNWEARLAQVIKDISAIQTEINILNNEFLNVVKNAAAKPQAMPQVAKDGNGLVTQAALLGFVQAATRLNAIATCEGNVQLSYFDNEGRMRQTNYDAVADSNNSTFEQWIPDAQRACLNFGGENSVVKLDSPVYLPSDWSIEAWFCSPLPSTRELNTLVSSQNGDRQIVVQNGKKLGIYSSNQVLGKNFYGINYSFDSLSIGWHHLTVVSKGDTTLFYIDGDKVGDTKTAAIAAANSDDKPKFKGVSLKITSDVSVIGNNYLALRTVGEQVMKFNGLDSYIEVPAHTNPTEAITVSVWAKSNTSKWNTYGCLVSKRDAYILSPEAGTTRISFHVSIAGGWYAYTSTPTIDITQWHHYAGTFDGQTMRLYVDGKQVVSNSLKGKINADTGVMNIGKDEGFSDRFFNGQIAEVRIWKVARTQPEIMADMNKRLTGKETDLVSYWQLNTIDSSGKVPDLAGSNHGTIVGGTSLITDQTLDLIRGEQFGKLAEVRIWGVALTDDEIAVNSKTLLSGNEPGLLAYLPLNEATEEIVRDQTGNGKNGTVLGANWWGCTASIGGMGKAVMKFDGNNDYIEVPAHTNPTEAITVSVWAKSNKSKWNAYGCLVSKRNAYILSPEIDSTSIIFYVSISGSWCAAGFIPTIDITQWHHYAGTFDGQTMRLYIDGKEVASTSTSVKAKIDADTGVMNIGKDDTLPRFFNGQIAEVRIWKVARTPAEIMADMNKRLTGKETNLVGYWPLNKKDSSGKVLDFAGSNHGRIIEAILVDDYAIPMAEVSNALVSAEYSTVSIDSNTQRKSAIMRRFFAYPTANGATLFADKRVEALELKWIGNAQFAPTLLGYIEGPPPVPSENLTIEEDYNGASSVELTMTEDVEFRWTRSQESGLGASISGFYGAGAEVESLTGAIAAYVGTKFEFKAGLKMDFNFNYQFLNETSIASSSSLQVTDKLELRGTPEVKPKFPHLGTRFIPKNVGYALVISAIADVFITRLARSGKMVGYQVQPVDGIPPDVNTITFLINPAYTMNGSLDGLTGTSATSDRFFKHVPEMRSQYGSLYPASYYRLKEAYALKEAIEAEDKRRESYFSNFNVRLLDETSLNRNIESGAAPSAVGVTSDTPTASSGNAEQNSNQAANAQANASQANDQMSDQTKQKNAEIQSKISDQEKQAQATDSFASWQKRMESLQIRSGKRNIVNTYVWDADGGLRSEAQSFANTMEHTIGGSFSMDAALGFEGEFQGSGVSVALTAQATVNLTQTMSKTESRSKGFELNVDLGGVECKGITNYKDLPILPGEKVDRYRFMSFYLEGSTDNFNDFFSYVVDPEWLASNDEEARALRQTQAGSPNKAWRVLHRVTYIERPALMGFGQDTRKLRTAAAPSENQILLDKIAKLEENNKKLESKLDKILDAIKNK